MRGCWGTPRETLAAVVAQLEVNGVSILAASGLYETEPLGPGRQHRFLNAALLAVAPMGATRLLALLKRLERAAGRTRGRHWGPRPLDIDIIHAGSSIMGWPPGSAREGRLILPHAEAHRRLFVIEPLADIAPWWRHPVLGATPRVLARRLGIAPLIQRRSVRRIAANLR